MVAVHFLLAYLLAKGAEASALPLPLPPLLPPLLRPPHLLQRLPLRRFLNAPRWQSPPLWSCSLRCGRDLPLDGISGPVLVPAVRWLFACCVLRAELAVPLP